MAHMPAALSVIVADFASIMDRNERAEMLIDYADHFVSVPEHIAKRPYPEAHRVSACESDAYVWSEPLPAGGLQYYFAVENPQGLSAKALSAILSQTISGAPLEDVIAIDTGIVLTLFGAELSMGKGQGLMGIVQSVRQHAQDALRQQA